MLCLPGFSCNQLAVLTQGSSDSRAVYAVYLLRIPNVVSMMYMSGAYDVLLLLSFYLTDFKTWHYAP